MKTGCGTFQPAEPCGSARLTPSGNGWQRRIEVKLWLASLYVRQGGRKSCGSVRQTPSGNRQLLRIRMISRAAGLYSGSDRKDRCAVVCGSAAGFCETDTAGLAECRSVSAGRSAGRGIRSASRRRRRARRRSQSPGPSARCGCGPPPRSSLPSWPRRGPEPARRWRDLPRP